MDKDGQVDLVQYPIHESEQKIPMLGKQGEK